MASPKAIAGVLNDLSFDVCDDKEWLRALDAVAASNAAPSASGGGGSASTFGAADTDSNPHIDLTVNVGDEPQQQQTRKRGRPKGSGAKNAASIAPPKPPPAKTEVEKLEKEIEAKLAALAVLERENAVLTERCRVMEWVLHSRDSQVARLRMVADGSANAVIADAGMSVAAIMGMSRAAMAARLREKMVKMGDLVMSGMQSGDMSAALEYQHKFLAVGRFATLLRCDVHLMAGQNVNEACESLENPSQAPQSHWDEVTHQVGLSPDQARLAWILNELFLRWHRKLLAERAHLSSLLTRSLSVKRYGEVFVPPSEGLLESNIVDLLQKSLDKERCLLSVIAEVYYDHIMTPIQLAHGILHMYPYIKDTQALLAAAAALHGPPTALPPILPALPPVIPTPAGPTSGDPSDAASRSPVLPTAGSQTGGVAWDAGCGLPSLEDGHLEVPIPTPAASGEEGALPAALLPAGSRALSGDDDLMRLIHELAAADG